MEKWATKSSTGDRVCPISSALDVLGDKWSLLIVRDLIIHGTRTYSEFPESPEHISTNILADSLSLLTSMGLIERTDPTGRPATTPSSSPRAERRFGRSWKGSADGHTPTSSKSIPTSSVSLDWVRAARGS